MRLWRKRHNDPPLSEEELAERRAAASEARDETARLEREIDAREDDVRSIGQTWRDLRARNHFGELITTALLGREP